MKMTATCQSQIHVQLYRHPYLNVFMMCLMKHRDEIY